ncbi:PD-(D/E)XK nuclease family protein [Mycoplasmatota bacterium WC30]
MAKTKNLFSYATKELSQDAFLRWLFENWSSDEQDIKEACCVVLEKLLDMKFSAKDITNVIAKSQVSSIDIVVDVWVNSVKYIIIIEDKTYTGPHDDQLKKYKDLVAKWKQECVIKYIYYKTNLISDDEISHIENQGWEIYDIKRIHSIFSHLRVSPTNNILADYVEHICTLYKDLTQSLPNDVSKWKINHWVNFYYHNNLKIPKKLHFGYSNYRGLYIYLVFNKRGGWKKHPYGEIRSRDFHENDFIIKILLYDTEQKYLDKYLDEWKAKFASSQLFKSQNYKQQIAKNSKTEKVYTTKDLESQLQKYIDEYYKLML